MMHMVKVVGGGGPDLKFAVIATFAAIKACPYVTSCLNQDAASAF